MKFTFVKTISAIAAFGVAQSSAQSTTAAATTAAATTAAAQSTAAAASSGLTPTEGDCAMEVRMQEEGEVVAGAPGWNPEGNIILKVSGRIIIARSNSKYRFTFYIWSNR